MESVQDVFQDQQRGHCWLVQSEQPIKAGARNRVFTLDEMKVSVEKGLFDDIRVVMSSDLVFKGLLGLLYGQRRMQKDCLGDYCSNSGFRS